MTDDRINYGSWAIRVVWWDALLPVVIALVPTVIRFVVPNGRGIMETTAVILPIGAFFARIAAGRRQIDSNHCSEFMRLLQFCVFCVGILPLIAIDCMIILSDLIAANALLSNQTDLPIFLSIIGFYLVMMMIAMYPGRTSRPPIDLEEPFGSQDEWISEYE